MKNNILISACAAVFVVMSCNSSPAIPTKKQQITIQNQAGNTIYGGVFLTNARGKILDTQAQLTALEAGACIQALVSKQQSTKARLSTYHRVIFSNAQTDMLAKIQSNNDTNVSSLVIKQLSGDKPLYYIVGKGKTLLRKDELKITPVKTKPTCGANIDLVIRPLDKEVITYDDTPLTMHTPGGGIIEEY